MLRSTFCILNKLQDQDLYDLNECPLDSGGYFVINGSEKVLIAQERMATNQVYVFAKAQPSPISFLAEIRSAVEKGGKTISQFQVKMYTKSGDRAVCGNLRLSAPQLIVYRLVASSKRLFPTSRLISLFGSFSVPWVSSLTVIFSNISVMIWRIRKCLKCSSHVLTTVSSSRTEKSVRTPHLELLTYQRFSQVALDFIGNRGVATGLSRERRLRYAQEILQKEMLPHISMAEGSESKKAYFFGYMVHRLMLAALERRELDDRDHFGKKRLDLAGPLLANLFRMLFRKLTRDVYRYLQKV